jgi:hypothetical protein
VVLIITVFLHHFQYYHLIQLPYKGYCFTKYGCGFFHYSIAKKCKEGYVLRVYDIRKITSEFKINHEVMNG